jgi:uncharacterized membrane protein (DUF373 family)
MLKRNPEHYKKGTFIGNMYFAIRIAAKIMAILMIIVIFWGVWDIIYSLYEEFVLQKNLTHSMHSIVKLFGNFLSVLIAVEIFENILLYVHEDHINVELVVATALMAISRKVIILDYEKEDPVMVFAIAGGVVALGITYWLLTRSQKEEVEAELEKKELTHQSGSGKDSRE